MERAGGRDPERGWREERKGESDIILLNMYKK